MTLTIDIPRSAEDALAAVGIDAERLGTYIVSVISEFATRVESDAREVEAWWASLSLAERAAEKARVAESSAVAEAGRVSSLEVAADRLRRRVGPCPRAE